MSQFHPLYESFIALFREVVFAGARKGSADVRLVLHTMYYMRGASLSSSSTSIFEHTLLAAKTFPEFCPLSAARWQLLTAAKSFLRKNQFNICPYWPSFSRTSIWKFKFGAGRDAAGHASGDVPHLPSSLLPLSPQRNFSKIWNSHARAKNLCLSASVIARSVAESTKFNADWCRKQKWVKSVVKLRCTNPDSDHCSNTKSTTLPRNTIDAQCSFAVGRDEHWNA